MTKYAEKWNREKHEYEPYELPDGSKTTADLDEEVTCAECGKRLNFDDTYTSIEIHTSFGFGYAVCEDCYRDEWKRRRRYEQ